MLVKCEFTLVKCQFKFVKCQLTLVKCQLTLAKCQFTLVKCQFQQCFALRKTVDKVLLGFLFKKKLKLGNEYFEKI